MSDEKSPKLIDENDPALGSAEKRDDGLTGDPREGQPRGNGLPEGEKPKFEVETPAPDAKLAKPKKG